jgi:hypothetical protein
MRRSRVTVDIRVNVAVCLQGCRGDNGPDALNVAGDRASDLPFAFLADRRGPPAIRIALCHARGSPATARPAICYKPFHPGVGST